MSQAFATAPFKRGGIADPAVNPIIMRMVLQCTEAGSIPAIGCPRVADLAGAIHDDPPRETDAAAAMPNR